MLRTLFVATTLLVSAAMTAPARAQTPQFFDGFLADNAGLPAKNFDAFYLWQVTRGTVDLKGPSIADTSRDPIFGRFVDLGGSSGDPGRFATRAPLPFLPGTRYELSFDYKSATGEPEAARVWIGERSFRVESDTRRFETFRARFAFGRTTAEAIEFQDLGDGRGGIGIDNVTIVVVAPADLDAKVDLDLEAEADDGPETVDETLDEEFEELLRGGL